MQLLTLPEHGAVKPFMSSKLIWIVFP